MVNFNIIPPFLRDRKRTRSRVRASTETERAPTSENVAHAPFRIFSLSAQCILGNQVYRRLGKMAGVQPPPLRSLDDFLLSSARFAVPDVRNLDRWNNRIINNLLYYQSNYFLSALGLLLIVG